MEHGSIFIDRIEFESNKSWLVEKAKEKGNKICIVSDGLFLPLLKRGALAWIITTKLDQRKFLMGSNIVPGLSHTQCSYRGELRGLLGGIAYWQKISKENGLLLVKVKIRCNGLEAIKIV